MRCASCSQILNGSAVVIDEDVVHDRCKGRHLAKLAGRTFECPVCKAKGSVDDKSRPIQKRVPYGKNETPPCAYNGCWGCADCSQGPIRTIGYESKTCSICKGYGYTARPMKPVTETVVVGWEEERTS